MNTLVDPLSNLSITNSDVEPSVDSLIVKVFDLNAFKHPLESDDEAREFVIKLHDQGVKYREMASAIKEHDSNFVAWKNTIGGLLPGIGQSVLKWLNKTYEQQKKTTSVILSSEDLKEGTSAAVQKLLQVVPYARRAPIKYIILGDDGVSRNDDLGFYLNLTFHRLQRLLGKSQLRFFRKTSLPTGRIYALTW